MFIYFTIKELSDSAIVEVSITESLNHNIMESS